MPGGVGPMTVAMLLRNTLQCAKKLVMVCVCVCVRALINVTFKCHTKLLSTTLTVIDILGQIVHARIVDCPTSSSFSARPCTH